MFLHPFAARQPGRTTVAIVVAVLALAGRGVAEEKPVDPAPRPAQTEPAPPAPQERLDRVEVTGTRNATDERRFSTAAKIVIGRDEIEQFGDLSLSDVMKRLPSVSVAGRPGRGGQIRMRGMGNGYTQILIDGDRIPRGFSIDQLSPDMVERIEIYRAPTAETGARAIAGTINIILREPLRQTGNDVRAGATEERGRVQPNLTWTRNGILGENGTYNLTVSASRAIPRTDTATETRYTDVATGLPTLSQSLRQTQYDQRNALHASSRVQWNLGRGDQISAQPFLSLTEGRSQGASTLSQPFGLMPAPYATSESHGDSGSSLGRLVTQWKQRFDDATRMELRVNVGGYRSHGDTVTDEFDTRLVERARPACDDAHRRSLVVAEREAVPHRERRAQPDRRGRGRGRESRRERADADRRPAVAARLRRRHRGIDAAPRGLRAGRVDRVADRVGERGAALGEHPHEELRRVRRTVRRAGPQRQHRADAAAARGVAPRSRRRATRCGASLTRSYRAPTLQNLIAVPTLSTLYPAPGANTASSPDRAGNPGLRPELATGVDVAFEHYLSGHGVVSISAFRRDIRDLIRNVVTLETVPWATVPRYVTRPRNIGDASTHGIEFDAKFQLDELVAGAPPLTLRTNVSVYGSNVSGVPGPYNRIDQQPRATANLGGDYRFRGWPLTVGGNFSWVPPYTVQETALQSQGFDLTRVLDAYVLWTIDKTTKVRLSLSNVVPRNYVTSNTIVGEGQSQMVVSNGPTYRVVGLRVEMKL